jgi:cytochrome b involved in lipid metabolism
MPLFGVIRQFIYGPYIAFVGLCFIVAEFRKYKSGNAATTMKDSGSLWNNNVDTLEPMTMGTFLDVTRLGTALCIVDGRILDITDFIDCHPGGPELLRYVRGSDITEELLGKRDVDGLRHVHSHGAMKLLNRYVIAKLVGERPKTLGSQSSSELSSNKRSKMDRKHASTQLYRRGKVVHVKYLTPRMPVDMNGHPVILLRITMPNPTTKFAEARRITSTPGCAFSIRAVDERGSVMERQYTPVSLRSVDESCRSLLQPASELFSLADSDTHSQCSESTEPNRNESSEVTLDFIISLIPGGKMSKFFLGLRAGKAILAQGPRTSPKTLESVRPEKWKSVVMIAAGTGVASMLQMIDYYLSRTDLPFLYLIWILKSPDHSYLDAIDLSSRAACSNGKFKWLVVYSSTPKNLRRSLTLSRRTDGFFGKKSLHHCTAKLSKQSQDWEFSSSRDFKSRVHRGLRYNFMKSKSQMHVKDMITLAPLERINTSARSDLNASEKSEDECIYEGELNSAMWSEQPRAVRRQFSKSMLEELITSANDYTALNGKSDDVIEEDEEEGDESLIDNMDKVGSVDLDFGSCDGSIMSNEVSEQPIMTETEHSQRAPSSGKILASGIFNVPERTNDYENMEEGIANTEDWLAKIDLESIAKQFKAGVRTGTHTFHFRRYENTFLGSDAVSFLFESKLAPSKDLAVALGEELMDKAHLFDHINGSMNFSDGHVLYRYTEADDQSVILDVDALYKKHEEQESPFEKMLVAISGSVDFEFSMLEYLKSIGLPDDNTVTFNAATKL